MDYLEETEILREGIRQLHRMVVDLNGQSGEAYIALQAAVIRLSGYEPGITMDKLLNAAKPFRPIDCPLPPDAAFAVARVKGA